MIGYVTFGTNDYEKSLAFYDGLLATVGAKRVMDEDTFVAWGTSMEAPALSVVRECANGEAASVGNGVMVALAMDAPDKVDAVHAKAMELGGSDDGAPGYRFGSFYAAYFRDPFGNKLNAFCIKPE
jgi:catechol 2,3-dioxygenase-like lactoylglutathione lyase family enzyme